MIWPSCSKGKARAEEAGGRSPGSCCHPGDDPNVVFPFLVLDSCPDGTCSFSLDVCASSFTMEVGRRAGALRVASCDTACVARLGAVVEENCLMTHLELKKLSQFVFGCAFPSHSIS